MPMDSPRHSHRHRSFPTVGSTFANQGSVQPRPAAAAKPRPAYARIVVQQNIRLELCRKMWALFEAHYDEISWSCFLSDLQDKSHVILIFDKDTDELCGFSTQVARTYTVDNLPYRVVFSGDTILDPAYRGTYVLARAFFRYMLGQRLRYPTIPLRWLLISKGYKTYLLLARNHLEYYPTYKRPTPSSAQRLLDTVCFSRFKGAYRPDLGVIRFNDMHGKLKPHVAPLGPAELRDPDIAFFARANPGHQQGDELACLGYFTPWMMFHFLSRSLRAKTSPGSKS